MKRSKYFLSMLFGVGFAFALDCFSIIYCLLSMSKVDESKKVDNALGFGYLFLHLLLVAVIFYFVFKAYFRKSSILSVIMIDDKGEINKKSKRNAVIFASIFGIIFIYFVLLCCGLNIFLGDFSYGFKFAIMNFSFLVAMLATFFAFYKPSETENK